MRVESTCANAIKGTWSELAKYESQLLVDRLLGIVGGSIGRRYDPANPMLIGVGLGKFSIRSGFTFLDSSLSFFVQKVTLYSRAS
jgi:hypothetical protein